MDEKQKAIIRITDKLSRLTEGQINWIDKVIQAFETSYVMQVCSIDVFKKEVFRDIGDALRIHHSFSSEPFTKDKFEYALVNTLIINGYQSSMAPKGNPGFDLIFDDARVSLKTQADRNIKEQYIWISKFMELGAGNWGDKPSDLIGLRDFFLSHLENYDKIFTLRALVRGPVKWKYELVEIPKKLLKLASMGQLEMKTQSKQYPKPGYCYVKDKNDKLLYSLYFDGGGERKLQIKNILKSECLVHAVWEFDLYIK